MASRELKVEIIGDSRSLQRALGSATSSASSFGSKTSKAFKMVGLAAAGAGVAIAGGFIYTLKRGFDELGESQKVLAQTAAGIKSTGGAANVTAKQVEELATSLSLMSGVDDEVIQQSENLLLTFTKVRNEVGKGNDVFNRATAAALDLSTRGFGSMDSAAKMMGKALQDPVKGMTALSRAGVTFTAGQKATIQGLVETGKSLDAQKLILAEVEKQVGGSAKAFGETMPGQLAKLRNAFDEMAANLAVKFLPILMNLVQWINDNWGSISAVFNAVGSAIEASFNAIGVAVTYLRGQWEIHRETAIATWTAVQTAVQQTIAWIQTNVVPAIQNVIRAATAIWQNFGGEIRAVGTLIVSTVKTFLQNMIAPFKIVMALLRGDWSAAWNEIKATVSRTLGQLVNIVRTLGSAIVSAAIEIGKGIIKGIMAGLAGLAAKVGEKMQALWDNLKTAAATALGFGQNIGMALMRGIGDGVTALIGWLKGLVERALGFLKSLNPFSTVREGGEKHIGKPIMEGAADGVVKNAPTLEEKTKKAVQAAILAAGPLIKQASMLLGSDAVQEIINGFRGKEPTLKAQLRQLLTDAMEAGRQAIASAREGYAAAFASLFQAGADAIAAKYAGWQPPSLLKAQREAEEREKAALLKSIADTQAETARLIAESSAASRELQALGVRPADLAEDASSEAKKARAEEQKKWDDLAAIIEQNGPKILAAQQSVDDLLFQQRQKMLAEQAIQEQKAKDAEIAKEQASWKKKLEIIMREGKNVGAKILALLKEFDIDFLNAGLAWGNQLAAGIRAARKAVEKAAEELAQAVADRTKPGSPAKKGPLSKFDMFKAGRKFGMEWAAGMASAAAAAAKAAGQTAGAASGRFLRAAGGETGVGSVESEVEKLGTNLGGVGGGGMPSWADPEIWEQSVALAGQEGQLDAFLTAVAQGSFKSNAGLLDQLFRRRTRWTWNDFGPRLQRMLEMMRPPEGLSGREVADYFGLLKKGGVLPGDGFYFGHKGETVVPPLSRAQKRLGGGGPITVDVYLDGEKLGRKVESSLAKVKARSGKLAFE